MASDEQRRRFERYRSRLSCSFRDGDTTYQAFATDLSAGGLFLQTRAAIKPGTKLVINIERDSDPPLVLTGTVARMRKSHRSAVAVTQPGFGFELESAPEAYFTLVMDVAGKN
ncbi:MAG: PilZ domain-containing protein [Deltaproteobacteria bacterium]|nr:PilZ domain-containing protein [Deltaproteobacteria bacterium]MBW2417564.1 PilZ domain-containing protein [Deltaproteobacteria bacterium]